MLIRFLFGIGESGTYPNCLITVSRWFPANETGRSLTWVGIGSQIGSAIAPLIIIWVKDPVPAMVICATMVALFPIISNTILGLRSVNPGLVNLFKLNHATRWQMLRRLRIPSALPYFFGGLRISSGLALIGAVVAEFVAGTGGTSSGLAYQILQSGFQLNIPRLFAALFLITLTGIVLFVAMAMLSKWVLGGWHESEMN